VTEYSELKVRLAAECGDDRGKYNAGKTEFVMKVLKGVAMRKAAAATANDDSSGASAATAPSDPS
jgi:GrpB-like predicted nucleotidyltransferase (UPF0157 family)